MTTTTIEQVTTQHAKHLETVTPGMPARFTEASTKGDTIAQGDLYLIVSDAPPSDYVRAENPSAQLVPEAGAGSHHRLSALDGVEVWTPRGWSVEDPTWDSQRGPWFRATTEIDVVHEPGHAHPHGTVTVPAGMGIQCRYQREWQREQARAARVAD